MKMNPLLAASLSLLLALVGARVVSDTDPPQSNLTLAPILLSNSNTAKARPFDSNILISAATDQDPWTLSVDRGTKLLQGMRSSDAVAATLYGLGRTAESPFDGPLTSKLLEWGYNYNTPAIQKLYDSECNMASASGHMLSRTFLDLGLDTSPNPAVTRDPHGSFPPKSKQLYSVCGIEYCATGAEHTIGINAAGGAIFALNLASAASTARRVWGLKPTPEQLPHSRSLSDLTWAFYNRAVDATPGADMKDIRYLFVTMIINTETNRHVRRALQMLDAPHEEPGLWPGHEFGMESEAGRVLLGSPVGRWAGYFLIQHKRQLGGDKVIDKVRVFRSEKAGSLPYLLFYVAASQGEFTPEGYCSGWE
ncbi:Mitochondrial import inner membrane translocase subunit tim8 [Ascochyta clinopodiicola]|nr:Mitochondrial import inner membrane translocase subunit tim8 [Ascochyta clinopodiicola]